LTVEEARQRLEELTISRNEINGTADPPGRFARNRATRVIDEGGQTYEIDAIGGAT
jgi:hypothetical protein